MRTMLFAATAALLLPFAVDARRIACAPIDEAHVEGLFTLWNDTLRHGTPAQLASLYADDAVLLPTVSNTPRLTNDARIDYFEHFQAKGPAGRIDERTIRLGCNAALDSGLYTFTFADGTSVRARYTFAYALVGKEWKIATHHSSAMPEAESGPHPH